MQVFADADTGSPPDSSRTSSQSNADSARLSHRYCALRSLTAAPGFLQQCRPRPPDVARDTEVSQALICCDACCSSRQNSARPGRSAEGGQGPDTARTSDSSGRAPKTPRTPADDDAGSPNQRSRKMRRADSGPDNRAGSFTGSE